MRRGRPSHTRSVVRAPLALLLVPSFRAWIPVATGALLPAAFHPAASRSSRHICPSAQDLPLASHLKPSKRQSSPGVCEAPRALAPVTAPLPLLHPPSHSAHAPGLTRCASHTRASGPWRFACGLDTPPATPAGLSLAPSLLWLVGPELHFCWDPCLPAAPPLGRLPVSFPSGALTAF